MSQQQQKQQQDRLGMYNASINCAKTAVATGTGSATIATINVDHIDNNNVGNHIIEQPQIKRQKIDNKTKKTLVVVNGNKNVLTHHSIHSIHPVHPASPLRNVTMSPRNVSIIDIDDAVVKPISSSLSSSAHSISTPSSSNNSPTCSRAASLTHLLTAHNMANAMSPLINNAGYHNVDLINNCSNDLISRLQQQQPQKHQEHQQQQENHPRNNQQQSTLNMSHDELDEGILPKNFLSISHNGIQCPSNLHTNGIISSTCQSMPYAISSSPPSLPTSPQAPSSPPSQSQPCFTIQNNDEEKQNHFNGIIDHVGQDMRAFEELLLKQCLCEVSEETLRKPFQSHYSIDGNGYKRVANLNEWPTDQLIQFLSNLQLLFDIYLKQNSNGYICARIMDVCDALIRNDHNLIDEIITLAGYCDSYVQFLAGRCLAAFLVIAKQDMNDNWLKKLIDNLFNNFSLNNITTTTTTTTNASNSANMDADYRAVQRVHFTLEIIKRIVEWKDIDLPLYDDDELCENIPANVASSNSSPSASPSSSCIPSTSANINTNTKEKVTSNIANNSINNEHNSDSSSTDSYHRHHHNHHNHYNHNHHHNHQHSEANSYSYLNFQPQQPTLETNYFAVHYQNELDVDGDVDLDVDTTTKSTTTATTTRKTVSATYGHHHPHHPQNHNNQHQHQNHEHHPASTIYKDIMHNANTEATLTTSSQFYSNELRAYCSQLTNMSGCHIITLTDSESFDTTHLKCNTIKILENKWPTLVKDMSSLIANDALRSVNRKIRNVEYCILNFLQLWENIISVKANLSIVETLPFYGQLDKFEELLSNRNLSCTVYKQILCLLNEALCYGSTLALQDMLPNETQQLAHQIVRHVKDRHSILESLPQRQTKNLIGFIGFKMDPMEYHDDGDDNDSNSNIDNDANDDGTDDNDRMPQEVFDGVYAASSTLTTEIDKTILQKMVLLILKSIAVTVKEIRSDSSDSSIDSTDFDMEDMTRIERSIRDVLIKLKQFVKEKLEFHPECHFSRVLIYLFDDQDDHLVEAMVCTLDVTASFRHSDFPELVALLNPIYTFLEFLKMVSNSSDLFLDLLVSNETCFLLYLLRFLKYICKNWSFFIQSCHDFGHGHTTLDEAMSVLIRLRLQISRLVSRQLYPYDISPVLRLLENCESLYEGNEFT